MSRILVGNPDASICHINQNLIAIAPRIHPNLAPFWRIFNCILNQIINNLMQKVHIRRHINLRLQPFLIQRHRSFWRPEAKLQLLCEHVLLALARNPLDNLDRIHRHQMCLQPIIVKFRHIQ